VDKGHYTVYLPAYNDKRIIKVLQEIKNVKWMVFSKHANKEYKEKNVSIHPINNEAFIESLISCTGILCGAGFETPAEALFLKKKLIVIPMKGQYEQQCNAAALKQMGIVVLKSLKIKYVDKINNWVTSPGTIIVHYPNITENIINNILKKHTSIVPKPHTIQVGKPPYSEKNLKPLRFKNN
jgi:UDP-N-acetylglucosamine:LPS N-acetylglucosamine transferase